MTSVPESNKFDPTLSCDSVIREADIALNIRVDAQQNKGK